MRFGRLLTILFLIVVSTVGCLRIAPRQILITDEHAQAALDVAIQKIGAPYVWGGQGPHEFDCSGLIIWAYAQVLPELQLRIGSKVVKDATQDELWKYNVQVIPPEQMKAGDIVFITNDQHRMTHGGLFIEWVDDTKTEFRFVNASSYWERVEIDTWPVEGTKRDQWFAGAGRLLVTVN